jgi:hypothetical protein
MATTVVSPTPSRILRLRQIIRIAAKGYEGSVRSWDHFLDDKSRVRKDAVAKPVWPRQNATGRNRDATRNRLNSEPNVVGVSPVVNPLQ